MNAVPTAAPDDHTYRVSWEAFVDSQIADMPCLTVKLRRIEPGERDPADSDGIPQAVECEVSARRGTSAQITDKAGDGRQITPAVKVNAMTALAELAYRDGKGSMLEYPILVTPTPGDGGEPEVRVLILRFKQFERWFAELAQFDFADIERFMSKVTASGNWFHLRRAAVQFLRELAAILPSLRQYDDTPYLLLRL